MIHFHRRLVAVAAMWAAAALSGCATARKDAAPAAAEPAPQALVDAQILQAAASIQRAQAELFQAAALDSRVEPPPADIKDDGQPVTLTWRGDATELLRRLARDRGLAFVTVGVRLPLPVKIGVKNQSFASVLQLLRAQIGYRGVISQAGDQLLLEYHRPQ